jgi:acyl-CoA synthetase (AMP-forming)/AMP-acid ligase II
MHEVGYVFIADRNEGLIDVCVLKVYPNEVETVAPGRCTPPSALRIGLQDLETFHDLAG